MEPRDDKIYQEAAELWRALFNEPPPVRASGAMMLDIITQNLPPADYDRLRSPHLRAATIAGPGQAERGKTLG